VDFYKHFVEFVPVTLDLLIQINHLLQKEVIPPMLMDNAM